MLDESLLVHSSTARLIVFALFFVSTLIVNNTITIQPVHMAALLYLNETVHARHLWRRTTCRDALFTDWWQVAKAIIEADDETAVDAALQKCAQEHPEPLRTYALEIAARSTEKPASQHFELNQQVITFLETKKWNM